MKNQIYRVPSNETIATKSNHEKSVELGEIFYIDLKGSATTGFAWVISELPSFLYALGSEYTPYTAHSTLVGAGGTFRFYFKAMSQNTDEKLVFKYTRPWEGSAIEEQSWQIDVNYKLQSERITDYAVANNVEDSTLYLVLKTLEEFNKYFIPTAFQGGGQRWINEADFDDNYVVATVQPLQRKLSTFSVNSVEINNNTLELKYNLSEEPISYYARVPLILLVEKADNESVTFIENGEIAKVVPV